MIKQLQQRKRLPLFRGEMSSKARQRGVNAAYLSPLACFAGLPPRTRKKAGGAKPRTCAASLLNVRGDSLIYAFVHKIFTHSKTVDTGKLRLDNIFGVIYNIVAYLVVSER